MSLSGPEPCPRVARMETTWTRCSSGPRAHTANQAMAKAMNPVDMTAHSRLSSASVVKVKALSAQMAATCPQ